MIALIMFFTGMFLMFCEYYALGIIVILVALFINGAIPGDDDDMDFEDD